MSVRLWGPWDDEASLIQPVNISWPYNYMKSNLSKAVHFHPFERRGGGGRGVRDEKGYIYEIPNSN
jgi:hypothetical protein